MDEFKEATHWLALVNDPDTSGEDLVRFAEWLSADPKNEIAFAKARQMSEAMDDILVSEEFSDEMEEKERHSKEWGVLSIMAA